jgi:hypothetical protein
MRRPCRDISPEPGQWFFAISTNDNLVKIHRDGCINDVIFVDVALHLTIVISIDPLSPTSVFSFQGEESKPVIFLR